LGLLTGEGLHRERCKKEDKEQQDCFFHNTIALQKSMVSKQYVLKYPAAIC